MLSPKYCLFTFLLCLLSSCWNAHGSPNKARSAESGISELSTEMDEIMKKLQDFNPIGSNQAGSENPLKDLSTSMNQGLAELEKMMAALGALSTSLAGAFESAPKEKNELAPESPSAPDNAGSDWTESTELNSCPSDIAPNSKCSPLLGKCYCFVKERINSQEEAAAICERNNMAVLSIETKEEDDALNHLLLTDSTLKQRDWSDFWTTGSNKGEESHYWNGDVNQMATYLNWCPGEPNNHKNEEHAIMKVHPWKRETGCWNDIMSPLYGDFIDWNVIHVACESNQESDNARKVPTIAFQFPGMNLIGIWHGLKEISDVIVPPSSNREKNVITFSWKEFRVLLNGKVIAGGDRSRSASRSLVPTLGFELREIDLRDVWWELNDRDLISPRDSTNSTDKVIFSWSGFKTLVNGLIIAGNKNPPSTENAGEETASERVLPTYAFEFQGMDLIEAWRALDERDVIDPPSSQKRIDAITFSWTGLEILLNGKPFFKP